MELSLKKIHRELALVFLKLGLIGFGGPAAHLALMESEVVQKRKWISRDELLDYISAANFIPGPNSTEVAIHIGYKMGGLTGLMIAGGCFILPAALLVTLTAWAYVTYGKLTEAQAVLYGIKPVIVAVILQALWNLSKSALKTRTLTVLCALACAAVFAGMNEIAVIFLSGCLALALSRTFTRRDAALALFPFFNSFGAEQTATAAAVTLATTPVTLSKLFLFFLKVGSVLFGSGYVLIAFLRADLVERWHWLTEAQLLDAIAVGQFTPGPVFTTATFIGYILAGTKGAVLATVGIFLPAFAFVALSAPFVRRLQKSPRARAFLDGLNAASLAVMAVATLLLSKNALIGLPAIAICAVSLILLFRFKTNSAWLVLGGALIGLALTHASP